MTASDLSNPVDKHPTSASFSPPPVDAILYLFYPFPVISPWILPLSIVLTLLYQSSVFLSKVLEVSKAITFIRIKIILFFIFHALSFKKNEMASLRKKLLSIMSLQQRSHNLINMKSLQQFMSLMKIFLRLCHCSVITSHNQNFMIKLSNTTLFSFNQLPSP